jgi:hypothetical protein
VEYDFGPGDDDSTPTDTDTVESLCDDLVPEQVTCATDGGTVVGCFDGVDVTTTQIDESAGCTPAGQSLGIVSFETAGADAGPIDLFAWVASQPDQPGPFAEEVYLSVFEDDCGDDPFGQSMEPDCAYRPWIVAPTVFADAPVYLHVQTLTPSDSQSPVALEYQVRTSDTWTWPLPADEPLECLHPIDSPPAGPFSTAFLDAPLWDGLWHEVDLSGAPPTLYGQPRICPGGSLGWRQAAFQLRNQGDAAIEVTRIRVGRRISPLDLEVVPFHFELLSCVDLDPFEGGVIEPEQVPLASSCHDDGEHASKSVSLSIEPWVPMLPSTQYVLILQVPPSAGVDLEVWFEVDEP